MASNFTAFLRRIPEDSLETDEDEKEKTNEEQPQEESNLAETSGKLTTSKTKSSYFFFK